MMGNSSRFHSPKTGTSETKTGSFELSSYLLITYCTPYLSASFKGYGCASTQARGRNREPKNSAAPVRGSHLERGRSGSPGAVIWDPTRRGALAQAHESLEQAT